MSPNVPKIHYVSGIIVICNMHETYVNLMWYLYLFLSFSFFDKFCLSLSQWLRGIESVLCKFLHFRSELFNATLNCIGYAAGSCGLLYQGIGGARKDVGVLRRMTGMRLDDLGQLNASWCSNRGYESKSIYWSRWGVIVISKVLSPNTCHEHFL